MTHQDKTLNVCCWVCFLPTGAKLLSPNCIHTAMSQ